MNNRGLGQWDIGIVRSQRSVLRLLRIAAFCSWLGGWLRAAG